MKFLRRIFFKPHQLDEISSFLGFSRELESPEGTFSQFKVANGKLFYKNWQKIWIFGEKKIGEKNLKKNLEKNQKDRLWSKTYPKESS